jgi:hypothetical protein
MYNTVLIPHIFECQPKLSDATLTASSWNFRGINSPPQKMVENPLPSQAVQVIISRNTFN